jgi:hypothetical protein
MYEYAEESTALRAVAAAFRAELCALHMRPIEVEITAKAPHLVTNTLLTVQLI